MYEQNAKRFGGNAQEYVVMRKLEIPLINTDSEIFHSFANTKSTEILPEEAIYLFSRKGWSNSPWFEENK